jgi:hypothetical protein
MSYSANPSIYHPGICWYMYPKRANVEERLCASVAALYRINSNAMNVTPVGMTVEIYLCDAHKAYLQKRGYTCTKVTLPPPPPGVD